ncbi:MAG: class I SAM-dependent methyltransferase [Saprospiraceae bacterium]
MSTKYNQIGKDYNLTRKADPKLAESLIRHLAPVKDRLYLDIGCGTGNYTNEFQKKGYQFIGIDPSDQMLKKAKTKNSEIDWRMGSAENTDLPKNCVDGIIGSLTIHHWTDLEKGFSELYSVLKEQGRIVIFTSTKKQMEGYWLNHYFPKMLNDSIIQMPGLTQIKESMSKAGFETIQTEKYSIHPALEDKFLYCGKQNPELYFDEQIRKGISSFSSLANKAEVEKGLTELRSDIDKGKIEEVIKSYENKMGDYLYIIGEKI